MMKIRERYQNDPIFRVMVDSLVNAIEIGQITPTEAREAAMLAQIMYESRHLRPMTFSMADVVKGRV
jgi:predicted RNA-binding protein associated with RNAse of E/G family